MTWPAWLYRLNDPHDRWIAKDKLTHLAGAWALTFALLLLRPDIPWFAALITVKAGIAVEAIEVENWMAWKRQGFPGVEHGFWPWMTDRASLKDFCWDLFGLALAFASRLATTLLR